MSVKININASPTAAEVEAAQKLATDAQDQGPVPAGIAAEAQPAVVHAPPAEDPPKPQEPAPAPYKNPFLKIWSRPLGLFAGNNMLRLLTHGHQIGWHYRNPYSERGPTPSPANQMETEEERDAKGRLKISPRAAGPQPDPPALQLDAKAAEAARDLARRLHEI
jgi:hypothetical protein